MLYFKKNGDGFPLIILHGLFGMGDNWATLSNQYKEHGFACYLIDQRNHGRSFHSEEFNYTVMAEDLHKWMQHEKIDKANLIGHSMGGKTAMFFATKYETLIHKLVIADIAPRYYTPHHDSILAALKSMHTETMTSRKEAEEQLRISIHDEETLQFLLKNLYWTEEKKLAWRFGLNGIEKNIDRIGEAMPDKKVGVPTLFLRGEKSGYITSEDELEIHKRFQHVKIETITNAGHWLHAENPNEFLQRTLQFLAD